MGGAPRIASLAEALARDRYDALDFGLLHFPVEWSSHTSNRMIASRTGNLLWSRVRGSCVEQRNLLAEDASMRPEQPVEERSLQCVGS
jgi:hypothetical protein